MYISQELYTEDLVLLSCSLIVFDFIQIMISLTCSFPEISFSIYTDAHCALSSIYDPKVQLIVYYVLQNTLIVCVWGQININFLPSLCLSWSVGCCSVGTLTSFPVRAV